MNSLSFSFSHLFRNIIAEAKTFVVIHAKYPVIHPTSTILSYIPKSVELGESLFIKKYVSISEDLKEIGKHVYIGDRTEVINCRKIGSFSSISHDVKLGLSNHHLDLVSTSSFFKKYDDNKSEVCGLSKQSPLIVEPDVLISANALIMDGITIGVGAVVGAGAFVNKDVPPYAVVAGSPGKVIRYRFDKETVDRLVKSKWWESSEEVINQLNKYSDDPNKFLHYLSTI